MPLLRMQNWKKSNLFQKQSFFIKNAFSFILISLLVVKIFKSLYLFFPCCPLLKQVMENIFSKSYIFDVMSWFNFTKKYILLNILGRKNTQVLKLDILEECYKKRILLPKNIQKIWKLNSPQAFFSFFMQKEMFSDLILLNLDNAPT